MSKSKLGGVQDTQAQAQVDATEEFKLYAQTPVVLGWEWVDQPVYKDGKRTGASERVQKVFFGAQGSDRRIGYTEAQIESNDARARRQALRAEWNIACKLAYDAYEGTIPQIGATPTPAPEQASGGIDLSKLTAKEQARLQQLLTKAS